MKKKRSIIEKIIILFYLKFFISRMNTYMDIFFKTYNYKESDMVLGGIMTCVMDVVIIDLDDWVKFEKYLFKFTCDILNKKKSIEISA